MAEKKRRKKIKLNIDNPIKHPLRRSLIRQADIKGITVVNFRYNNFRGISLLSVVGKVYGRVLINRIRDKTENVIAEVQGGFRRGRGCTDQIFTVRRYARSI